GYREDGQHDVPKIEKPAIDQLQIDPRRQSEFAKSVMAMPVAPLEPVFLDPAKDYAITDDPNGIRFYYVKNPINDLFALTFATDVGTDHDNRLMVAQQLLDKSGTKSLAADALQKEWYKLGTSFNFGVGDTESSFSIAGLDENLEPSLALMMDVINNPRGRQDYAGSVGRKRHCAPRGRTQGPWHHLCRVGPVQSVWAGVFVPADDAGGGGSRLDGGRVAWRNQRPAEAQACDHVRGFAAAGGSDCARS
ncbi:MAG TPA: hypothetical protein PLJ47_04835, partial [Candidatus Hydrogenedentes bacterium]|nr:hypothetical protein [Candidatus Hydrogenedentota bacterium]